MIRFGVVLSVVLVAIGLLAAGVVAGSLLLVITSIGVAVLAFLLLLIVVVMSRHELFGQPDGRAGRLAAIEPAASAAAAASSSKARPAAGPAATATLEPRAPAVPAGVAAQAKVAAQPVMRRGRTEISKASKARKARKGRGEGQGPSERLAPAVPAGGPEAETRREAATRRETVAAKTGAEIKGDKAPGQPVVDRPATTAPDRAAASAKHGPEAPIQRPPGAQQAAKDAPAAGVAAGSSAAASAPKDKRGEQATPAVQLIDAAAAKAKAGAEEVMQEAAAERSSVAKSGQTAGGQPPAETSAADSDRPKEYGASKLERESARAASARAAADQGDDAKARQGPATVPGQGTAPEQASPAGKPAASAGSAEPAAGVGAAQVSVVPGITRYHRGDCLLIRFLSSDDLEVMTRQAAIENGCVPCKACKPDDETASLRAG